MFLVCSPALLADRTRTLVERGLEELLLSEVPGTWGGTFQRRQVLEDLKRRSHYLQVYVSRGCPIRSPGQRSSRPFPELNHAS